MGSLAAEAAALLQDFRPLVRDVQDDLEMAITLLAGAGARRIVARLQPASLAGAIPPGEI